MSGIHRSVMNMVGMNKRPNPGPARGGKREFREVGLLPSKSVAGRAKKTLLGNIEKLGG